MKKRITVVTHLLALMPLLIGISTFFTSILVTLAVPEKVKADNADFFFKSAYEKSELGDPYGAISDYTKAIQINPDFENAYINRGISKRKIGDYQGAISDYNKALTIDSKDADTD